MSSHNERFRNLDMHLNTLVTGMLSSQGPGPTIPVLCLHQGPGTVQ